MQFKQLDKFIEDNELELNEKLLKHLLIIGMHALRQKTQDISNITIKMIAGIELLQLAGCKEQNLKQELNSLRQKVVSLERHLQEQHGTPQIKSQVTPKITESVPPLAIQPKKATPFKHHLDDSEIKSILWNQFNTEPNTHKSIEPIKPKEVSKERSLDYHASMPQLKELPQVIPIRENSLQETRQNTQRSSHSGSQRNKSKNKENAPKIPKHLRQVQSKIKPQIQQAKVEFKSSIHSPKQTTPQHKYFQPCNSTKANILDEIATSFLNSPFLKSQVKQRLFREQQQSSASSTFSLFPKDELKSIKYLYKDFFCRDMPGQQLQFQF